MLLGYGLSCLTDRSDRHKNLLLKANLNSLTRSGKKTELNFLYPARQHLRLNRRNTKLVVFSTVQNDKFSATVRTCSVTDYGSIECKTSLSNVCTFGIDYPVDTCNQGRPQKFSTDHMQSSYSLGRDRIVLLKTILRHTRSQWAA